MADRNGRWALLAVAGVGIIGAGYWVLFSSFSQLVCHFPYRRHHVREPIVALTFDDGPNEPFTTMIGDFLHQNDVRATFFQVGKCVQKFPEVSRRLIEQGHVIGNHSYSHRMGRCWWPAAQLAETAATQEVITDVLGRTPALYRPPWLLRTPTLPGVLREARLRPVSGVFAHAFEVFQPRPPRMARRALAKVRPGVILIFHDGFDSRGGDREHTVEAVKIVVRELINRDYRFVTVDELLQYPAYRELGLETSYSR